MRRYTEQQIVRIGVISVVVAILAFAAALNLQKFPGFRGVNYQAEITDASGLHKGNMVQVAGIRVGRVGKIDLAGDHVVVLGAAGGVGLAAVQVAVALGATVTAVASSPEKLEAARAHGASHLVDHRREDVREALRVAVPLCRSLSR